jgi:hypothetical protein
MKPSDFKYSNRCLSPSGTTYSDNVTDVESLHVWTDGEQCLSMWRPSWRERLSILIFGRVWLALLSGQTQPPALVVGCKEYLTDDGDDR